MLRSAILMILLCRGLWASAETVYTVDCNGGGDFRTIQACFDALPSKPAEWRTVRIMPGTYREKVTLDVYKDKVVVVGCGKYPDDVRLVWDDYSGKVVDGRELTTYGSYTFSVQADDVLLHNFEVCNDAGRVGQAVALETRGDRIWIDGCRLIGNQDTFFTKGYVSRVFVTDSYIEGTTDFIFGPSIVEFVHCTIHCKADSFITAASTTERNKYGYVFIHCHVTAAEGVTRVYLGRPWKSTARTVWLMCELPGAICPEGWRDWHDAARKGDVFYAEFGCYGPGADRSGRVAWSRELTVGEAVDDYWFPRPGQGIFSKKTGSEAFRADWCPGSDTPTDVLPFIEYRMDRRMEATFGKMKEYLDKRRAAEKTSAGE